MKRIKFLLISSLVFFLLSCSSPEYDPELCRTLASKIENHEVITDGDCSEMIDQLRAIGQTVKDGLDPNGNTDEKIKTFRKADTTKEMGKYAVEFSSYLAAHQDELSPENLKKLTKTRELLRKIEH